MVRSACGGQGGPPSKGSLGGRRYVGTLKNHQFRSVPFPTLAAMLAQQCVGKHRDDLLFANEHGGYLCQPVNNRMLSECFRAMLFTQRSLDGARPLFPCKGNRGLALWR